MESTLIWGIFILIALGFVIPSLSSTLKEKVMGKVDEEKFDLDRLVQQKVHKIEIAHQNENTEQIAFYLRRSQSELITLMLSEIQWGAGSALSEVKERLSFAETDSLRDLVLNIQSLEIYHLPQYLRDSPEKLQEEEVFFTLLSDLKSKLSAPEVDPATPLKLRLLQVLKDLRQS